MIIGFGVVLLLQGIFPDEIKKGIKKIPGTALEQIDHLSRIIIEDLL